MKTNLRNSTGTLTAYAFACGYVEKQFGALREIHLMQTAPGCDYVVTALTGFSERLTRRANFTRLTDARKFANRLLIDLTAPAIGGVDTL